MDFETSESGLLIPKETSSNLSEKNRLQALFNTVNFGVIINFLMVIIQLFTGWILWKTYQDTVIPNRQKELLSEQVAQLELEQKNRTQEIKSAQQRVQTLDKELQKRRDDLLLLFTERQKLLAITKVAKEQAETARTAEISAKYSTKEAQSSLQNLQWSSYYETASSIMSLPRMKMIRKLGEFERAGIGADDSKLAFHTYLKNVEIAWPNMEEDARSIERELLSDDSKFYPRWMIEEFSGYFIKNARHLSCPKPNFASIKADADSKFDSAAAKAISETQKEQAERQASIDEAMKRRVKIPYTDSMKDYEIKVAISNANYEMINEIEKQLSASIEKCNRQFYPIADEFFTAKKATQQTLPKAIFEEFNNN